MRQKILALVIALAVGGSVSAYAAACNQSLAASAVPTVKTATVSDTAKSADSAVRTVSAKTVSASSAAKNQTCSGGNCASKSTCTANSCTNGAACSKGNCTASSGCGTTAAAKQTRLSSTVSGSDCIKRTSSCTAGAGCTGTDCGTVYVCGGSGYSCNSVLNGSCGKSCFGVSGSPVKPAAPKTSSANSSSAAPTASSGYSAFQNEVVRLVNAERAKSGLAALTANDTLMKTATVKSQDMAKNNYFSHTSPTYGSPFDLMKKYGVSYRFAGENIAMGQTSPSQVMNDWMNSTGHRENILKASYTKIGVGVAQNAGGQYYWTQHFIG